MISEWVDTSSWHRRRRATIGGVNKLKNSMKESDVKKAVYGSHANDPQMETAAAKAVDEVVKVDFHIQGCPIDRKEFTYIVRCLATGRTPFQPTYPVCVECKMKGNVCMYWKGEICLGPLTKAGCGARCPSSGFWCFGCRGYVDSPNVNAAKDVMSHYGKTIDDLKDRMMLFDSRQEPTYE